MMKKKHGYVGWALPESDRSNLLAVFEPSHPDVVAHHVTLAFGVKEDYPLPTETTGRVVGIADDAEMGIQALVIEIGGTTERSTDGKTYHITWSLDYDLGAKAMMSNTLLTQQGFTAVSPIIINLIPQFFES